LAWALLCPQIVQAALKHGVKNAATSVLRRQPRLCTGLLRAAAARGRGLVLCYHRVTPHRSPTDTIDPLHPDLFAQQLETLKKAGDVLPIASLMQWRSSRRPAFAVTFDDDDTAHVTHALPILRALNIPAAFFLSGRSLHGFGAYWWTQLQQAVDEDGLDATCRRLARTARTVRELARQCRANGGMQELSTRTTPRMMQPSEIQQLADAGMTIGFHTVRHPALTLLDDRDLAHALVDGRDALASAARTPVDFFAYPYGLADRRVADAAERAGYRAAFALGDGPMTQRDDRFLLARWQPGALSGIDLVSEAALRLNRTDYRRAIRL
jgi:peptidoglycan/xylan/chitin deacetylase (PgdA/CDA1 family)